MNFSKKKSFSSLLKTEILSSENRNDSNTANEPPPKKKIKISENDYYNENELRLIKKSNCIKSNCAISRDSNFTSENAELTAKLMKSSSNDATIRSNSKQISFNNHLDDLHLFRIAKIKHFNEENFIELNLIKCGSDERSEEAVLCFLHDSWTSSEFEENDRVHVLGEQETDGSFKIDDQKGLIILNPHYVLSGTTIISGLHCLRKSALNWKFKDVESNGSSSMNHMVLGSILHMLFQSAIINRKYDRNELSTLLVDILKRKQILSQLYEASLNEEFIVKETSIYLSSIEKWLHEHVKLKPLNTSRDFSDKKNTELKNGKNFQISSVCDIEESIWSPSYGVKGKLDLTLQLEIKMSAYRNLANTANKSLTETHVIPVELKSGRTTFSAEHEGQVMLYSLLNSEKRKTSDFGLLLYLKDMNMKFIKATSNSIRGLIQLRNELVHFIASKKLPELKNEERLCSKCPMLTVCSLFSEKQQREEADEIHFKRKESECYANSLRHLSDEHKAYFFGWYKMLELEFGEQKQFESGNEIWWKTREELEATGLAVFDLKLARDAEHCLNIDDELEELQYSGEGFFLFEFKKSTKAAKELSLKENDMILLSSQTDNLVGISQGFIRSVYNNNHNFTLLIDKNLSAHKLSSEHLFRIDKINYRSAISLNYTNLARLMLNSERCLRLRRFLVDRDTPSFESKFSKQTILKTKQLFAKLNQSQKAAILKVLMAKDYLLIKGYPGTGKTTTIAALIAILVKLEKKVLFTSFTNSAVDNLLLKLQENYSVDFVRVGSYEKIHSDVQKFELNCLTSNLHSTAELDSFFKSKQVFASTCSSISHQIFSKIDFDYCIIDEASQVLLTTCLGPLFNSKIFVLVGDLEQLPPIIKNKDARILGMGVSLFEWLDCKEGSIELVHQYRMNKEIMTIANEITYNGKLECFSEKIANSEIEINAAFLHKIKLDHVKQIFTRPVIMIDTTYLIESVQNTNINPDGSMENNTSSPIECEIVSSLCSILLMNSKCKSAEAYGIIAPYNNQVKAIQNELAKRKLANIEINTVDQFQGRDKRIVLMSFTNSVLKSLETKEFEILNDKRRLTVAITRAKEKLILIGCVKSLTRYKPLSALISLIKEKNLIVSLTDLDEIKKLE